MKTIFVTGGTGYLGGHLLKIATQSNRNLQFRCLTRHPRHQPGLKNVKWIDGDLSDKISYKKHLQGCSMIVHLATISLLECEKDPLFASQIMIGGLQKLLNSASEFGIRRWILTSSAEVYGHPQRLPISETTSLKPLSIYGFLKACADLYMLKEAKKRGLSVCLLRFFNLYGAGINHAQPSTVLKLFAQQILNRQPVLLHASMENSRDFLHVKDAARAIWLTMKKDEAQGVINIGSGKETTLIGAARKIARLAKKPLTIDFRPKEGRFRRAIADIRLAKQILNFIPKVTLDCGLHEVLDNALARDI